MWLELQGKRPKRRFMDVVKEDMKLVGDRRGCKGWGEMKADDWMIGQWPPAKETA